MESDVTAAHLEIEGEDYGTVLLEGEFKHGEYVPPEGHAYFCSVCARVWATVRVPGRRTFPWTVTCSNCKSEVPSLELSGSVMLLWNPKFNNSLNRKALAREFEIAYQRYKAQEEILV